MISELQFFIDRHLCHSSDSQLITDIKVLYELLTDLKENHDFQILGLNQWGDCSNDPNSHMTLLESLLEDNFARIKFTAHGEEGSMHFIIPMKNSQVINDLQCSAEYEDVVDKRMAEAIKKNAPETYDRVYKYFSS